MNTILARRFTVRYILALSLLAGLTIWGQVLVQRQLSNQQHDAYLINYAGRQRFQSQEITKNVLLLASAMPSLNRDSLRQSLRSTLLDFENFHYQLQTGQLASRNASMQNSDNTRRLYLQLEPHFKAISVAGRHFLTASRPPMTSLQQVLYHEGPFLLTMDQIVLQYQGEVQKKVTVLQGIEKALLAATLLILLLEALLIFYPAVTTLREIVGQLIRSERQMREANAQLNVSHQELKAAQEQLLKDASTRYHRKLDDQRVRLGLLIQGQEEERRRLSRELHDGIGQMLTGLKLLAENIRSTDQLTPKDQQSFQYLKGLLIRTIQETRDVSNNLMPPVLSDFGLEPALRQLIEQQARHTDACIELHSDLKGNRFNRPVEIGLYRIAQEALHNAIKHAGASDVQVSLLPDGDQLNLIVDDNGQGFQMRQIRTGTQGLHNMRERTKLLNGTFEISSELGSGTSIRVLVPV